MQRASKSRLKLPFLVKSPVASSKHVKKNDTRKSSEESFRAQAEQLLLDVGGNYLAVSSGKARTVTRSPPSFSGECYVGSLQGFRIREQFATPKLRMLEACVLSSELPSPTRLLDLWSWCARQPQNWGNGKARSSLICNLHCTSTQRSRALRMTKRLCSAAEEISLRYEVDVCFRRVTVAAHIVTYFLRAIRRRQESCRYVPISVVLAHLSCCRWLRSLIYI